MFRFVFGRCYQNRRDVSGSWPIPTVVKGRVQKGQWSAKESSYRWCVRALCFGAFSSESSRGLESLCWFEIS